MVEAANKNFAEFQAKEKALTVGKRYINLFHQLHVIDAGLEVLNQDFLSLPEDVINVLPELSGGNKFRLHIQNLKDGTTPINKIARDLLPFGPDVFQDKTLLERYTDYPMDDKNVIESYTEKPTYKTAVPSDNLANENEKVISNFLLSFKNTPAELEKFKSMEEVRDFGPEWKARIANLIENSKSPDKDVLKKTFDNLCVFDYALQMWNDALALLKNPKLKTKDDLQKSLPDFKKYLSMFGGAGTEVYNKIEALSK